MTRHIYYLVIDSPERSNTIAHAISGLADDMLTVSEGTLTVDFGVIVPHDNGVGLRTRVTLEEVKRDAPPSAG